MKNNSDMKFSYQQLPVSLKLIYTILQVLALNYCIYMYLSIPFLSHSLVLIMLAFTQMQRSLVISLLHYEYYYCGLL